MNVKKTYGFTILRQLTENDKGYLPTCAIYKSGTMSTFPEVWAELRLPREATDADMDQLRIALKNWAARSGFGELAEEA